MTPGREWIELFAVLAGGVACIAGCLLLRLESCLALGCFSSFPLPLLLFSHLTGALLCSVSLSLGLSIKF